MAEAVENPGDRTWVLVASSLFRAILVALALILVYYFGASGSFFYQGF